MRKNRQNRIHIRSAARLTRLLCCVLLFAVAVLPVLRASAYPLDPENPETEKMEELLQDVRDHVLRTRETARRTWFDGMCAAYVHWQLMAAGINTEYRSGDAFTEYRRYCGERLSSGGFLIEAIPATDASLEEALREIASENTVVHNVMVCFRRGTGTLARYGHVLFIRSISDGLVYYTESSQWKIDGVRYPSGTPIRIGIRRFAELYGGFRYEGTIHFYQPNEIRNVGENGAASEEGTDGEEPAAYDAADYLALKSYVCGHRDPEDDGLSCIDADGNGRLTMADCLAVRERILEGAG